MESATEPSEAELQNFGVSDDFRDFVKGLTSDTFKPFPIQGNDGREYVRRRILHRVVRYGREVLKDQEGFFNGLVPVLVTLMGGVFSELEQHEAGIREIIKEEEEAFGKTLLKGIEKFKKATQDVQGKTFSGQVTESKL